MLLLRLMTLLHYSHIITNYSSRSPIPRVLVFNFWKSIKTVHEFSPPTIPSLAALA